ncbi:class I SAM-dependent methyltransferase [Gramella sp. GC03-9]|uniref:Class I SAM-dependent methyltransferase n=1 Tax=Christiangramia oceanisediminis TaxID=2920386 RepID=A0A9X2I9F6_9FLAO|nr:class I SAM-dependent methyltransferase [Gramella oceanisediminis]MCP9199881.1 class I SAM-dependent methyltransferase [Gramella oceanisediminis]
MEFKDKVNYLNNSEVIEFYKNLSDVHIQRKTDLNGQSVDFIMSNIIGNTVLDIACGRGYLANKIAQTHDLHVTGVDFIIPEDLKNSIKPVFVEGKIENIPFADNSFETVICAHTLEHVVNIQKGISELRRVCSKRLIIVLPRQREYKYTFDLHVHFFPYKHSVFRVLKNNRGQCTNLGNDWLYIEDYVKH